MPPPLSPQQQHSHAPQGPRAHFAPSFGGGRELPGLGAHRPGSSMSISSLIGGGDAGASNQTPQSQASPSAPSNAPPPNHHTMQPPSPRRGNSSGSRTDFQHYRRQPSPEKHMYVTPGYKLPGEVELPPGWHFERLCQQALFTSTPPLLRAFH
jgi:hypothetical protein